MERRSFLVTTAAAPLLGARTSRGARPRRPHVRWSCNLYTFNGLLTTGAMTLPQALELCADLGFDAVDPTGYYFPNHPAPPDDAYVHEIKRLAFQLGLDVSGTGVRNDFCAPEPERRQADVAHVGRWVEVAARLGAPCLRVFSGRAVPDGPARDQARGWLVQALRECARLGAARGVTIVLQNHHDFLKTAAHTLEVLDAVGSPWLGLNLDIGSLREGDPYAEIERLVARAVTWQIKETVWYGEKEVRTDLRRLARTIKRAGYRGYLPLELLGKDDPRPRLPRFLDAARAAFA